MANLISVERATLALGTAHVLDGVSLGINAGARIGIVGRNGGGKSTLMKVLHGDLALDDGRITDRGTHEELMERSAGYRTLVTAYADRSDEVLGESR